MQNEYGVQYLCSMNAPITARDVKAALMHIAYDDDRVDQVLACLVAQDDVRLGVLIGVWTEQEMDMRLATRAPAGLAKQEAADGKA